MTATTIPHGPLSFVGGTALLYGAAFLPAAKLTVESLMIQGIPFNWALFMVALAFPALLFPSLPTASRNALLRTQAWARTLIALPAAILGVLLGQLSMLESYGDWDGLSSFARLAFGVAAFAAGGLLIFWDPPPAARD